MRNRVKLCVQMVAVGLMINLFVPGLVRACIYGCKDVEGATNADDGSCWSVRPVGDVQCLDPVYHGSSDTNEECDTIDGQVTTEANSLCAIWCSSKIRTPKAADTPVGSWGGTQNTYDQQECTVPTH